MTCLTQQCRTKIPQTCFPIHPFSYTLWNPLPFIQRLHNLKVNPLSIECPRISWFQNQSRSFICICWFAHLLRQLGQGKPLSLRTTSQVTIHLQCTAPLGMYTPQRCWRCVPRSDCAEGIQHLPDQVQSMCIHIHCRTIRLNTVKRNIDHPSSMKMAGGLKRRVKDDSHVTVKLGRLEHDVDVDGHIYVVYYKPAKIIARVLYTEWWDNQVHKPLTVDETRWRQLRDHRHIRCLWRGYRGRRLPLHWASSLQKKMIYRPEIFILSYQVR